MMTDAEIEVMMNDFRERAFFVSNVEAGAVLSAFERAAKEVEEGDLSFDDAVYRIQDVLAAEGYEPPEKGAGGIGDLSSWARIQLVMETNVRMAHGFQTWVNLISDPLTAAFRFFRSQNREAPRLWRQRWEEARAGLEDEATEAEANGFAAGETVGYALARSEIWKRLSRFGQPFPPFDFFSGMNIEALDEDEAGAVGLTVREEPPIAESFNATLSESAEDLDPEALLEVERRLGGAAYTEEDEEGNLRLVYSDPNGTKPYTNDEMAELMRAKLPEEIPNRQAESFKSVFMEDVEKDSVSGIYVGRLMSRIIPEKEQTWYARPEDFNNRGRELFIHVNDEETAEYSMPIVSDRAVLLTKIANALGIELDTPWAIPF